MSLGSLLKGALKFSYDTSSPTGKYGVVKNPTVRTAALTAAGAVLGGPAGAAAGYQIGSGISNAQTASKNAKELTRAQALQAGELAKQQKLADSRLLAERTRTDQSLLRLSRGRVRGSLFGDAQVGLGSSGQPGATLG